MQGDHVTVGKKGRAARRNDLAIGLCPVTARLRGPPDNIHPKGAGIIGHHAPDAAIAIKAERATAQSAADTHLPRAGFDAGHLLGQLAHGGEDQRKGQLGGGVIRPIRFLVRTEQNARVRAGVHIHMRPSPALRDQPQVRQPLKKIAGDAGALPEQHDAVRIGKPRGQRRRIRFMIGPYGDIMSLEQPKTWQFP